MTTKEAVEFGLTELEQNKVEGPRSSSEFLLRKILGVNHATLLAHPSQILKLSEERKYQEWILRRKKHEPVWYIVGEIEFFGQDFIVNENVLIPRPETEILVEKIIGEVKQNNASTKVLDVGTGCGAIILTLASCIKGHFFASDISGTALKVAKLNAKRHKADITFREGDLLAPWLGDRFDLIVANLPYVPHEDMSNLAFDLIHYEPRTALDGGVKGLEIYQRFLVDLPDFLNPGGNVYCEIGHNQGKDLIELAEKLVPNWKVSIVSDYSDQDRILVLET